MSREIRRDHIQDPLVVGRVVGDVVDLFTRSAVLRVLYNNRPVANGAGFKPSAVRSRPRVHVDGDGDGDFQTLYTLVLVDPDSPNPSNPTKREYLHWLVTNIPGSTSTDAYFGHEIVAYEAPEPSVGIHRLVFVLFRQSSRQTAASGGGSPERRRENFNTRAFAVQNQLGQPAAIVYFNCQRESGAGGRRFT